jgi:hypothetical protein
MRFESACSKIGMEEEHYRRIINIHPNTSITGEKGAKFEVVRSEFGIEEEKLLKVSSVLIQV